MTAELTDRPWLVASADRTEAEGLLDKKTDGTFLVRGSNTGGYALSIVFQKHVYHYRILLNDEKRFHIKVKQQSQASTFGTLDDLVTYYSTTSAGLVCVLAHPVREEVSTETKEVEPAETPPQQAPLPSTPPELPPLSPRREIMDEKWKFLEACRQGNLEDVNTFLKTGVVDVNATDSAGYTALHWAALKGHSTVVESLLYSGAFPNMEDSEGCTPLHKSCAENNLDVVKLLVANGAMLNRQSKDGSTSLHVACVRGANDIVRHLLASGVDPTVENNDGDTPLHIASRFGHLTCVQELLSVSDVDMKVWNNRGATAEMLAAENGKEAVLEWLKKYKPSPSYHEYSRVILCGKSGAGKSTLAQYILDSPKSTLHRVMMRFGYGDSTKHPTAGIVSHTIQSFVSSGDILLYDLAGDERYHSMHYAYLQTIAAHSPSTFVIAVDLTETNEDITRHLFYWGTFIDCVCYKCPRRSSVVVVGTHGDKLKNRALSGTCTIVKQIAQCVLKRETFVDLVTTQNGEEVSKLVTLLQRTVEGVVERSPFACTRATTVHSFLKKVVPDGGLLMTVSFLHLHLMNSDQVIDTHRVIPLLRVLSRKGLIIFLEKEDVAFDSLVVVQKEALLEKVVGTMFAPPNTTIGNSAGIVTLKTLQKQFPDVDSGLVVDFLTHFEMCLQIINVNPRLSGSEPESVLFFPDLINQDKPSDVAVATDSLGWRMLTGTQFYTRYFFCVLVVRMVQQFSLLRIKSSKETAPLCPQCEFWSNGLFWVTTEGVSVFVEMKDCNQLYVSLSPWNEKTLKCLSAAKSVLKLVKKTFGDMCPGVAAKEFIELKHNSTPALVLVTSLRDALKKSDQHVVDSTSKRVSLGNWRSTAPQLFQLCSEVSDLQQATQS